MTKPNQSKVSLPRAKPKERILWMDALTVVAAFCVVLIHSNYMRVFSIITSNSHYHLLFLVICVWAVPVFFMLSGAKLMGYRERYSTKTYFLKRTK
jgi:surface polysaccharide O-acyltransferase-like enzyme